MARIRKVSGEARTSRTGGTGRLVSSSDDPAFEGVAPAKKNRFRVTSKAEQARNSDAAIKRAEGRVAAAELKAREATDRAAATLSDNQALRRDIIMARRLAEVAEAKLAGALDGGVWHRGIDDPVEMLLALNAQRHLATLRTRRAVHALNSAGMSQTRIAQCANVSQAHISRTVTLIEDHPSLLDATPEEVAWRHAAGEISTEEMVETLAEWPYTEGRSQPDAYEAGTRDQLTTLLAEGFLTEDQFKAIRARAQGRG